jgi:hypothetical protein
MNNIKKDTNEARGKEEERENKECSLTLKTPNCLDDFRNLLDIVKNYAPSENNHSFHLFQLARLLDSYENGSRCTKEILSAHTRVSRKNARIGNDTFIFIHNIRADWADCSPKQSQRVIKKLERNRIITRAQRKRCSSTKTINIYRVEKIFENLRFVGDTIYIVIDGSLILLRDYLEKQLEIMQKKMADRMKLREEREKCLPYIIGKLIKYSTYRKKSPELEKLKEHLKRGIVASDTRRIIKYKIDMPERLLAQFDDNLVLEALDKMERLTEEELRKIKYFVAYLISVCTKLKNRGTYEQKELYVEQRHIVPKLGDEEFLAILRKYPVPQY